jgi:magnesium transporter
MIRSLYYSSKGSFTIDVPQTHWRVALRDTRGLLWVDFGEEPSETVEPPLRDIFSFHPLAIDDALREAHVPKIDNWGDYVYIVQHIVVFDPQTIELTTREVDIFLGPNYLVTHHRQPIDAVNRVWTSCQNDQRRLERGPDHLLYNLLDLMTAEYMPVVDVLDETIDQLEDDIFSRPSQNQVILNTIFSIKRAVLHMRRVIVPQREVLNRLARDEYTMIDAADRVYFRDIYDHLVRLADINESLRDLIGGTLDTYLSVTSNRINEVMKVLTIISALFMPISFMSGFFGMNFTGLPFDNPWLLGATLTLMILIPTVMLWWFRKRGWL